MFMKRKLAKLIVHIAPQTHLKFISTNKNSKKILYMRVPMALYVMVKSALVFHLKPGANLESQGVKINPHDQHVANKMMNEEQMTIVWHVDDLKMSHKCPWEITKLAIWLSSMYGEIMVQQPKLGNLEMDPHHLSCKY